MIHDRLPPHDIAAEVAVLGSMILDPATIPVVGQIVSRDDFYRSDHAAVYRAIVADPDAVDFLLVANRTQGVEDAGDLVASIVNAVPSAANAEHYARVVKTKANARAILRAAQSATASVYEGEDPGEIAAGFGKQLASVTASGGGALGPSLSVEDLEADPNADVTWLADGILARGTVNLFSGHFKAGKTTMLLALLGAVERGDYFLDRPTAQTRTLLLSEQSASTLLPMLEQFGLRHVRLFTRTHLGRANFAQAVAAANEEAAKHGCDLVVVDTFAAWAGLGEGQEQDAGATGELLGHVLRAAESTGSTWILTHHLRKSGGEDGLGARGSSNIGAIVDVLLELQRVPGQEHQRKLSALGRVDGLIDSLVIELNMDTYSVIGTVRDLTEESKKAQFERTEQDVLEYVESHPGRTRKEIFEAIPGRETTKRNALSSLIGRDRIIVQVGRSDTRRREHFRPLPEDQNMKGVPRGSQGCPGQGSAKGVPEDTPFRGSSGTHQTEAPLGPGVENSIRDTLCAGANGRACPECGRPMEKDSLRTLCIPCAARAAVKEVR